MKIIPEIRGLVQYGGTVLPEVTIEKGALQQIPLYMESKRFKNVILVADKNTNEAAGLQLSKILPHHIDHQLIILQPNQHGQVLADEPTLIQLFAEMPPFTDALIAVGTGTIHDIVRFIGYKMNIPFISVPTAASVDGFTSKGAPLLFRGMKQTVQTTSPLAVFADVDLLAAAPKQLTAAGFGDILGKYTSLLDWKISELIGNEPYNQLASDITRRSLEACVSNAEMIAQGDADGIAILMQSLVESGLVMLLLDFSRPASGGEHHLSHFWEMDLLDKNEEQLLHGAKVGVATAIISELYKQLGEQLDVEHLSIATPYNESLRKHWGAIKDLIDELPDPSKLRKLLKTVGGPTTAVDLHISNDLVQESLNEAYKLRERCTGLFLINQFKQSSITYPIDSLPI
ncbi:sn-glycerol-1-phosphate dehydrogenase [Pseudalkalibacillus salsuginis]|uniref:sn-glycerol-1-phosphate dehydrogenase n=1 Tax=Pseudalkalibacillus salsuginis TaxID=2910972 RepID=UPI001F4038CC|nr:sn-glycerol-1-phosphate dehydrogenase [Pseudalkalibacillus salsuginis]MCF6409088.1 sn-glycerol-1-phosphate dehydrogenase [Pseudalkalibacillus salsuginis]